MDFMRDLFRPYRAGGAFPNDCHTPAESLQCGVCAQVTLSIGSKLRGPFVEVLVWRRCVPATLMAMPKTAAHFDNSVPFRKHDIWSSGEVPAMEAKAQAQLVQGPPHLKFRPRVLAPNAGHH
jgi:hypothetical protein